MVSGGERCCEVVVTASGGRDIIYVDTMATYGGRESWMAVLIEMAEKLYF